MDGISRGRKAPVELLDSSSGAGARTHAASGGGARRRRGRRGGGDGGERRWRLGSSADEEPGPRIGFLPSFLASCSASCSCSSLSPLAPDCGCRAPAAAAVVTRATVILIPGLSLSSDSTFADNKPAVAVADAAATADLLASGSCHRRALPPIDRSSSVRLPLTLVTLPLPPPRACRHRRRRRKMHV